MTDRLPVIALVGRPNVGKSTLFNRLTRTRDALVADLPGLTRDRQYGFARVGGRRFVVVDTGGLGPEAGDSLAALAEGQARLAIAEADHVLFLTDFQAGDAAADHDIAAQLRSAGRPVTVVVNKSEGRDAGVAVAEFHGLGLGHPVAISAEHGHGISDLVDTVLADVLPDEDGDEEAVDEDAQAPVRVAIIGRPNVGKSTLVNRLLGEERVLAADYPGTTRDSIRVRFDYLGVDYELIDTAGIRRRAKVQDGIERFSVIKSLQAIDAADATVVMVDARDTIGVQDARILGLAAQHGRGIVLAVNKWDGMDEHDRKEARRLVDHKLPFLDYVPLHFISAKHGSGLRELMRDVRRVRESARCELSTPELNKVLEQAVHAHAPPAILGRRIKLRYAHQGGRNPPRIVIHGNQVQRLSADYKRYLVNRFRAAFKLVGVPIALEFRSGENPYAKGQGGARSRR